MYRADGNVPPNAQKNHAKPKIRHSFRDNAETVLGPGIRLRLAQSGGGGGRRENHFCIFWLFPQACKEYAESALGHGFQLFVPGKVAVRVGKHFPSNFWQRQPRGPCPNVRFTKALLRDAATSHLCRRIKRVTFRRVGEGFAGSQLAAGRCGWWITVVMLRATGSRMLFLRPLAGPPDKTQNLRRPS